MLTTDALKNYGGASDLETVSMYLENLMPSKKRRDERMVELFDLAFEFIDNGLHWKCIRNLAKYMLENKRHEILCEEIIAVCDRQVH